MNQGLQNYYDQWETVWMKLYYRMVWAQLGKLSGKKILDFGSGFGWNANHFAKENEVLAIEPNAEMIAHRLQENSYEQIQGTLADLSNLSDRSFDLILCHNVFEYAPAEREEILQAFSRLIKFDGLISIVKHNHAGGIFQKIVFENELDLAYDILTGGEKVHQAFGKISYYDLEDMTEKLTLKVRKTFALRTFWALQPNEFKAADDWADKMFKIEYEVCEKPEYAAVSFFNHLLLEK